MSRERNKALMHRFVDEFWNGRRTELADELFASDATSPSAPWAPPGPAGVRLVADMVFTGFPDFRMEIDGIAATEDRVAARFVEHGTHSGAFMGISPTGKQATWTEVGILRIEDDKVVESWFETDLLGLMQQLGAVPVLEPSDPPSPPAVERTAGANENLVRRYIEEVWNQGYLDAVDDLFAPEYTIHAVGQSTTVSHDALKRQIAAARATFPDLRMAIDHVISDGDKVTTAWTTRGTQAGEFRLPDMNSAVPPSGRRVSFAEICTFRVADGRIAEGWYVADRLTMLQQLGLGPGGPPQGAPPDEPAGSREEAHKFAFRRFAERAWNNGDLSVVDEVFAPQYLAHASDPGHDVHGPEGHKQFIATFREAFPDVEVAFGDLLVEGDFLAARMSWTGTHTGAYMGISPTGKRVSVDVTGINRFQDGKVVEAWGVVDMLGMLQQLGAIPSGASAAA